MKLIFCVDDGMGMMFNRRRQSQDQMVRAEILRQTAGQKLWLNRYSAGQFAKSAETEDMAALGGQLQVDEAFVQKTGPQDWCFVEDFDPALVAASATEVLRFCWNRNYPADVHATLQLAAPTWIMVARKEFAGSSHEKITIEHWMRQM